MTMSRWTMELYATGIFLAGAACGAWTWAIADCDEPPRAACPTCPTVGECWDGCLSFTEYAAERIVDSCAWTVEEQKWCDEVLQDMAALQDWSYTACDPQVAEVYDSCATAEIQRGFCPSNALEEDVCMCMDLELDRDECNAIRYECFGGEDVP